jgi:hypothetical protein
MKRLVLVFAFVLSALLLSPHASAQELFVDLRTNYSSSDFSWIRVQVLDRADERRTWTSLVRPRGDVMAGVRAAELEGVSRGDYYVVVELLDGQMRTVHGRVVALAMPDRRFAMTMLIVRP